MTATPADSDDESPVTVALRRLRHIADELATLKARTEELYGERMAIVWQLRGQVSQQVLADACGCGVDMVKNISANARRKFERNGTTV